jgi:hypothetical protein
MTSTALFPAPYSAAPANRRMVPVAEASTEWAPDTTLGGLPADRGARMAARRAFVILKLNYLYVVEGLEGADELKARVRLAETPEDLWALRSPLFQALSGDDTAEQDRRRLLSNSLDAMFPPPLPVAVEQPTPLA